MVSLHELGSVATSFSCGVKFNDKIFPLVWKNVTKFGYSLAWQRFDEQCKDLFFCNTVHIKMYTTEAQWKQKKQKLKICSWFIWAAAVWAKNAGEGVRNFAIFPQALQISYSNRVLKISILPQDFPNIEIFWTQILHLWTARNLGNCPTVATVSYILHSI